MRHVSACRNAVLPGGRLPLRLAVQPHAKAGGAAPTKETVGPAPPDSVPVGWVPPKLAAALVRLGAALGDDGLTLPAAELCGVARRLAEQERFRWRDEAFDVRAAPGGPVLAQVDRGALPVLGIWSEGVHLNGLVRRPNGAFVWVARRAANKQLDPGKLDHLVGGGIPAGLSPWDTLAKEAEEEAAIPAGLIAQAVPVATISYAMDRPEGLRRDRLHCYDLHLPESFTPHPADGEVEAFELWPLPAVLDHVRRTDDFKFNVNLVLIDLFLRYGLLDGAEREQLRSALGAPTV